MLGKPRFTADLDAVILLGVEDLPKLVDAASEQGITPRIAEAEVFARKNWVLLLRHQTSGININISLGILPFETEMVERSRKLKIGSLYLRLPTTEDLIILKAVAHWSHDLTDIQAIAASNPDLDRERVQFWVELFGAALELPDLWKNISRIFTLQIIDNHITAQSAGETTGYNVQYFQRLLCAGKLEAIKIGQVCLISLASLKAYFTLRTATDDRLCGQE